MSYLMTWAVMAFEEATAATQPAALGNGLLTHCAANSPASTLRTLFLQQRW
jgi:hypothetical protein